MYDTLVSVAGGMSRGSGVPLWMRSAGPPADVDPSPVPQRRAAPSRRHCWVATGHDGPCEGLLISWTRELSGWHALVVYVDHDGRAITEQLPADRLRPATG